MTEDLLNRLEKLRPLRVVLRLHEGAVQGKVEQSFSMDWDPARVCIFWSGEASSIIGSFKLDGVRAAEENSNRYDATQLIIDPLAADSPIEVDWEAWFAAGDKFRKRNPPFKLKGSGLWQIRALVAERQYAELKPKYDSLITDYNALQEVTNKIRLLVDPNADDET